MIRADMYFSNFDDFYERKENIRRAYGMLTQRQKAIYKCYVYSQRIIKEKVCDEIWRYLNAVDEIEYGNSCAQLNKEYNKYR